MKDAGLSSDYRRYDSIAILIQGDAVCGASCFDGRKILLATNSGEETALVQGVKFYLKIVAQKASEKQLSEQLLTFFINAAKEKLLAFVSENVSLYQRNPTYQARFKTALNKVTRSIKFAFRRPEHSTAFPFRMAEAMRKGDFLFLNKENSPNKNRPLHAEMRILDYLHISRAELFRHKKVTYIGVSKKCCKNCEMAIKAFNIIKKDAIVCVRGEGHGFSFVADIPSFLLAEPQIHHKFLELRGVKKLEEAFLMNDKGRIPGEEQLLSPSGSLGESTRISTASTEDGEATEAEESSESIGAIVPQNNSRAKSAVQVIKQLNQPAKKAVVKIQKGGADNTTKKPKRLQHVQSAPAAMFAKKPTEKKQSIPRQPNTQPRKKTPKVTKLR